MLDVVHLSISEHTIESTTAPINTAGFSQSIDCTEQLMNQTADCEATVQYNRVARYQYILVNVLSKIMHTISGIPTTLKSSEGKYTS